MECARIADFSPLQRTEPRTGFQIIPTSAFSPLERRKFRATWGLIRIRPPPAHFLRAARVITRGLLPCWRV